MSTESIFESCVETHGSELSTHLLEGVSDGTEAARNDLISLQQKPENKLRHSKCKGNSRIWDLLSHVPTFMVRVLRLLTFVIFLLPAFIVFLGHYLTCDRVAVYYGKKMKGRDPIFSRQILDIYGSRRNSSTTEKKPVLVFLTGGAWIIGYRMWGALLGRALAPFGILVVLPDYGNFPGINIEGMVNDVDMSIQWVFDHIESYGGDPTRVVLAGQSAGAHIAGVIVSLKVLDCIRGDMKGVMPNLNSTYSPGQLAGLISTSAPNNLVSMRPIFQRHGLSENVQKSIFADDFERWSPYHIVEKCAAECTADLKDIFPQTCVIHGTEDRTVPVSEAYAFLSLLGQLGINHTSKIYSGWSHTDPILEAPMRGDHLYHRDVYELVLKWTRDTDAPTSNFDDQHSCLRPICPSILVRAARFCNPF